MCAFFCHDHYLSTFILHGVHSDPFFFVTTDEVKFRQHKIVFEKRGAKVAIDPFVGHDPVVKTAKE